MQKTFQRRTKKPAAVPTAKHCTGSQVCATALSSGQAPTSTAASSPESQQHPDEAPTPATTESTDSSSSVCNAWLGHLGLGNRRSSCLVPFQGLEGLQGLGGLLLEQQQASKTKREEQQRAVLKELLLELAAYFSEVDAYELLEESPEPSPDPKAKRKDQNRAKGHRQTTGKSRSSHSPPPSQRELSIASVSPLHSLTPHDTYLHSLTPHTARTVSAVATALPHSLAAGSKAALLSATPYAAAPAAGANFPAGHPPTSPVAHAYARAYRAPGSIGPGNSSKQQLLSTTPSSVLHKSRTEGSCGGHKTSSDPQAASISHDQLGEGPAATRDGARDNDLHVLAADESDQPSCPKLLHTGRRSSAQQQHASASAPFTQPSEEAITLSAAVSRRSSTQQHASISAPFPLAGRRSSVLLPQAASLDTWNAGRRSSLQPAATAAATAAAAAGKDGEAPFAGRRSSVQVAATAATTAEKGGGARRAHMGRRSSVLVHPQAGQAEGPVHTTLPPMPQGTCNTRARSSSLAGLPVPLSEASRCAAADGGQGATSRSSNASTTGWGEKEERVTEGTAAASAAVEMEGCTGNIASERCTSRDAPRGVRQRGSRGGSMVEAASCFGDGLGDTVQGLGALPEGDEEDGRRAGEEEGLEEFTQKDRDDESRDQKDAGGEGPEAGQGEVELGSIMLENPASTVTESASTVTGLGSAVAGAVGGQQGPGLACTEGSRDECQRVDPEQQKCRSTSAKGAAKGGRRGRSGAAAAAKQGSGGAKGEVADTARQPSGGAKSEVADTAKQRREVESEVTDTVCGMRDQGWGDMTEGEEVEGAPCAQAPQELSPLQQLLQVCSQSVDTSQIPSMDAFICGQADLRKISKIGEGTYGEAFKHNKVVFKVVPVEGQQLINGAPQKLAQEMAAEALIALTLTSLRYPDTGGREQQNVTPSFVETFEVGVCKGPYPAELVRAWHKWDKAHGSENDPVDSLQPDQLYLVIAMRDCGRDLEKASIASFDQARSLLVQVALTLAIAEEAVEFEHRDLHWGNVLVRPADSVSLDVRLRGVDIEVQTHGMAASIIDFTASRLRTLTGALAYCDLSCDPELFEGTKGVIQFDTYRWMRRLNQGDWSSSCFATNCLWMAYLAEMIVKEKATALNAAQKRQLREFRKRASQALSCGELICDELFKGLWIAKADSQ